MTAIDTAARGQIRLLCGGNASARAALIDRAAMDHWGRVFLIVPTREQARRRAECLIFENALPGAWGECVIEFNDFARRLLESEGVFPVTLDSFDRRLLLVRQLDRLLDHETFAPVRAAAATPGFASQILHIITELKQAAIEPDEFRARVTAGKTSRPLDGVVALAYAAYQKALQDAGLYDIPGLYWEADLRCRNGRPRMLDGVETVCFDGFDDFTPSQLRLIASASAHARQALIGVNFDEDPDRADLYALSGAAARAIATRFGCVAEYHAAPAATRHSEFAARTLFWRNPPTMQQGLTRDLTVAPCADPAHEIEMIARRVKALLVGGGVAPDRIAVVFRRIGDAGPALRAVFREVGVPVRVVEPSALAESAVGAFLQRLIGALDEWDREAILDLLASPLLGATQFQSPLRDAFRMVARQAGVLAGFDHWVGRLEWLSHALRAPAAREFKELLERYPGAEPAASELLRQVRLLHTLWEALPLEAPPAEHAFALETLCEGLGLPDAVHALADEDLAAAEGAALNALRKLLASLGHAGRLPVPREDLLRLFHDGLQETTYRLPSRSGAVGVYDAPSIRNLDFDYVFFAGLNEGEAPMPGPMNAVYTEADLDGLRGLGIGLGGQSEHNLRERLLFHHVLETARERLTLSWHVHSPGGKEAAKSPFLKEILDLFGAEPEIEEPAPFSDAFVPRPEAAASQRDLRNCAFFHAPALRDTFAGEFTDVEAGAAIEHARRDGRPFGPHDGVLADGGLKDAIAGRFGPEHSFSASQLETYLECPFRFFQEQILNVAEAPEPSDELEPMLRGLLLHDAMRRFHERYRGKCFTEIGEVEAIECVREAVDAAFDGLLAHDSALPPGAVRIERRRMIDTLARYVRIERGREEEPWRPVLFEAAFGGAPDAGGDAAASRGPLVLDTGEGPVQFYGRIDRIDEAGDSIRVVDYKSSAPPAPKEVKDGRSIQLGLYTLAGERLICTGKTCVEALFIQPGRKKKTEALDRAGRDGGRPERERVLLEAIAQAIRGIRDGRFPPVTSGEACRACGREKACRFERARIERKTGKSSGEAE